MKIVAAILCIVLAFGYLGVRVIEYVTAIEGAHQIVMGENS